MTIKKKRRSDDFIPTAQQEEDLPFLTRVRRDPKYKRFKLIIQTASERLRIEDDRNEALALHASRTSRKLYGNKAYSPKAIIDASENDMQARSRLVEIRVKASMQITLIKEAMEAIKEYVVTEYASDMSAYSNEQQRKAVIARIHTVANGIHSDGEQFLDLIDRIIVDIDKSSYHLTTTKDLVLALANSTGGKVI